MDQFTQNPNGVVGMNDQVIASDLLISAKSSVRNYAMALTEAATPEVREILRKQLDTAISTHEQITNYMINKGYYHAYDVKEQLKIDFANANNALNLPNENSTLM